MQVHGYKENHIRYCKDIIHSQGREVPAHRRVRPLLEACKVSDIYRIFWFKDSTNRGAIRTDDPFALDDQSTLLKPKTKFSTLLTWIDYLWYINQSIRRGHYACYFSGLDFLNYFKKSVTRMPYYRSNHISINNIQTLSDYVKFLLDIF